MNEKVPDGEVTAGSSTMTSGRQTVSFAVLCLMATVTMMAILSELVPSGILPELMAGLNISEVQAGNLVGVYAIASAISAIPLISATVTVERKKLLMGLLIGFAASNVLVGLAGSYGVALAGRLIGGICAGVLWPMIAAYGVKLVNPDRAGQAIAIIMAGTTVGMSVGMPVMTWVGRTFGWRIEFHTLAAMTVVIMILMMLFVPNVPGEARTKDNSPFTILRNRGVMLVVLLTLLAIVANYGVYVYMTLLVETTNFAMGITGAQIFFGLGCVLSVLAATRFSDSHLRYLIVSMMALGASAYALLAIFGGTPAISHFAYFAWGYGFGALVSVFQAAVSRQVTSGTAVATSVQSATFNFSIMIATSVGGYILTVSSMNMLLIVSAALLVLAGIITFSAKQIMAGIPQEG